MGAADTAAGAFAEAAPDRTLVMRCTDPVVLSEFVEHPDVGVRMAVVCNPRTTLADLRRLTQDPDPQVRSQATRAVRRFRL